MRETGREGDCRIARTRYLFNREHADFLLELLLELVAVELEHRVEGLGVLLLRDLLEVLDEVLRVSESLEADTQLDELFLFSVEIERGAGY